MLYNPQWHEPADVFTLDSLISWLETQPPEGSYDWLDVNGCLVCLYLQACGYERPSAHPGLTQSSIRDWGPRGYYKIARNRPWTFGAALERACESRS